MKQLTILALAALFYSPAHSSDTDEAGHAGLPHAFDAGWEGKKTCEVLFEDATTLIGRCVFPPGTGHEKHYHNPHFGYVLEGSTLRIVDSKGTHEVTTKTGGTWSTDSITIHEAVNTGESTTSYLIIEPKQD